MALVPISTVCGATVASSAGETLGSVVDVMLDDDDGGVGYAVLSFGGTLGVGEKLFAVPWKCLTPREKGFAIAIDREALEQAPGFDKDAWPTEPDPIFS